jgi:hypothetical protein
MFACLFLKTHYCFKSEILDAKIYYILHDWPLGLEAGFKVLLEICCVVSFILLKLTANIWTYMLESPSEFKGYKNYYTK